jgi:hypothetical protein
MSKLLIAERIESQFQTNQISYTCLPKGAAEPIQDKKSRLPLLKLLYPICFALSFYFLQIEYKFVTGLFIWLAFFTSFIGFAWSIPKLISHQATQNNK